MHLPTVLAAGCRPPVAAVFTLKDTSAGLGRLVVCNVHLKSIGDGDDGLDKQLNEEEMKEGRRCTPR